MPTNTKYVSTRGVYRFICCSKALGECLEGSFLINSGTGKLFRHILNCNQNTLPLQAKVITKHNTKGLC